MPQFIYKAIDSDKHIIQGSLSAKTSQEAASDISKRGLTALTIKEINQALKVQGSIPQIEKITFCRYLSTMLASGLSLSEGVAVLHEETKHPLMKRILSDISYSLEQGQQLSNVFERYPTIFEPYFLTLVRAGEVSGKLAEVFKYLEHQLHSEYSMQAKIKGALLYPGIVFTAMIGIGIMMFFFILPQIGRVFLRLNLPLPFFTKTLFSLSIAMSQQVIPILLGAIVVIIALVFALRSKHVKEILFRILTILPLVKNMIKKIDMARFNRIFSTLLKSAVPITEALEISLQSLTWYEYRNLSQILPDEVRKGKTLSQAAKDKKIFPTLIIQMMAAGEKTGTLDVSLGDLASFYEEEVEEELKNLAQIIEPILMLLVGIAVGAMILSIIGPIYSVVGSFQQAGTPGVK